MTIASPTLQDFDPELAQAMRAEAMRQEDHAELIASENYASPLVMAVQDSVFTNKYAEGYPGRRYYSGCEHVDVAERLALERVKALFDCDYANVQPHAGAQANAAVFLALTRPGDTVMGMNLAQGGHLTHGNPSNFSGRHYHIVPYGLDPETGLIDYDEMERIALRTRPRMLIGGFSAYSRHKDWARMRHRRPGRRGVLGGHGARGRTGRCGRVSQPAAARARGHQHHAQDAARPRGGIILAGAGRGLLQEARFRRLPRHPGRAADACDRRQGGGIQEALAPAFKDYQRQVVANARAMAAVIQRRGYRIVSGGTDNHLMLIDLSDRPYTGKDADAALSAARITANKNSVPNDPRSPFVTSGLRIGTPALTTRGFGQTDCETLAGWLCDVLDALAAGTLESVSARVAEQVTALCRRHSVYRRPS